MPKRPRSRSRSTQSRGNSAVSSTSLDRGAVLSWAASLTVSRIISCSSLSCHVMRASLVRGGRGSRLVIMRDRRGGSAHPLTLVEVAKHRGVMPGQDPQAAKVLERPADAQHPEPGGRLGIVHPWVNGVAADQYPGRSQACQQADRTGGVPGSVHCDDLGIDVRGRREGAKRHGRVQHYRPSSNTRQLRNRVAAPVGARLVEGGELGGGCLEGEAQLVSVTAVVLVEVG